jgi:CAAX protease family protein
MAIPRRPDLPEPHLPGELPPATWRAIEALPLGLIVFGAVSVIAVVLVFIFPSASGEAGDASPAFFAFANLAQQVLLMAGVAIWIRFVSHGRLATLAVAPRRWTDPLVGMLTGLALIFLAVVVSAAVTSLVTLVVGHTPSAPEQIPEDVNGGLLAVSGVVVVLLAPTAEEMFFRGFLYRGLRRRFGVWASALISGAFFGLVHFAGVSFLLIIPSLVLVGVGLAWIYERRGSLIAPIAAHATFNLLGLLGILAGRR